MDDQCLKPLQNMDLRRLRDVVNLWRMVSIWFEDRFLRNGGIDWTMVASRATFPNWSSSYLHLAGCTVEYVVRGAGQPLVLVPGLAGGVDLLEPLIERLSRRYQVVACQLRGEGWGF